MNEGNEIMVRPFRIQLILFILLTSTILLMLASCMHTVRDGAPDFYVDETRIPDAVPKVEPLARYGNMKSYQVFGKRYYVMPTNAHYDVVGIASWYGTKFHRRRTSSGEPYNLLGMTAAHRTLPLPTYVEVTNLRNNRQVVVKVNDRGPFHSDRLIDLSYVAAKKLGIIGHGTALVRVKALTPAYHPQRFAQHHRTVPQFTFDKKPTSLPTNDSIYLQVGAFRLRENAMKLQQRLLAILMTPVHIEHPSYQSSLYRVQIGPLKNTLAAERISKRLKRLGIACNKQ